MRSRLPWTAIVLAGLLAASPAAALDLGQPLPGPADGLQWITPTTPVDFGTPDPARHTLVAFLIVRENLPDAPRYVERLSALARNPKLRVVLVFPGNAGAEDLGASAIQAFFAKHPCPGAALALDARSQTLMSFLPALPPNTTTPLNLNLPIAFLADPQGRLLWTADPPMGGMESVVDDAVAGRWTIRQTAELARVRAERTQAAQANNAAALYLAVRKLAKLEPDNPANYPAWHRMAVGTGELDELDEIFAGWMKAAQTHPAALLALATAAIDINDVALRRPREAQEALLAAYAQRGRHPQLMLQIAAVYHRLGNLKAAGLLIGEALRVGNGNVETGIMAAMLQGSIYGPEHAVKILESLKADPAQPELAKALADHTAYQRSLQTLAAQPFPPAAP